MNRKTNLALFVSLLGTASLLSAALTSTPATFDFGWAPDNARISCEFIVKNTGDDPVGLQALKPACGCTAAQFSPMSLASDDDTRIGLTFNTRGYAGSSFNKSAELTTAGNTSNIVVYLKGYVANPNAAISPVGNGIAAFLPGTKSASQKITLQNKTDKDLALHIIQPPASWAKAKLSADTLKAGKSVDVTLHVSGSVNDMRETSLTIEGTNNEDLHRVTLAIRTGAEKEYQPLRPTSPAANPAKQTGPADPLKLKPIEPIKSK